MDSMEQPRRGRKTKPAGARALALRWLARRPLAEGEIRKRLAGKGLGPDEIDRTVTDLIAERLLDDPALALDFVVLRSARLHHGKGRLMRELEQRGVSAGVAERAYQQAVESGALDPEGLLRESVAGRLKRERDPTAAGLRRVYNALLRAGFPAAGLYAELKRQRDALDDLAQHEYHDESS
jgi:regulatory protein